MFSEFHFLRPYWLLMLIPFVLFAWQVLKKGPKGHAWAEVCDGHLLPHLIHTKGQRHRRLSLMLLLTSALLMIFSLSGPSWSRFPVPTYHQIQPRVLVLDMSDAMLVNSPAPNRLSRAKFKIHDLLSRNEMGQFGLVVYSGEPFIVSPLTDDSQTIDALLPMLFPNIMPVKGNRLDTALQEAAHLITQAGFNQGNILVLTATAPTSAAMNAAKAIHQDNMNVSVMPILSSDKAVNPLFQRFADAGGGELVSFTNNADDLVNWLKLTHVKQQFSINLNDDIPVWQDKGRLFILPALLLLLPLFRQGWSQRISS